MLQTQGTHVLLYSKSYLLKGGTAIPSGADMNDYDIPGNYYVTSSSTAQSFANSPFTTAFTLKVEYANGTAYPCQTFTEFSSGKKAWRLKGSSGWNDYVYFSDDVTLFFGTIINRGDDLNDFITPGRYYCADSSFIGQISNIPENFGSGFTMAVYRTIGENVIQVIFRSNQSSAIYTRAKITAGWQSWYKYTGTVISS